MKNRKPQIIIMAVLGLVAVALISVTVYQVVNKTKTDEKATEVKNDTKKPEVVEVKNKTFDNSQYTFEYPGEGWSVRVDDTNTVLIETPDYEVGPMSVTKGASVSLGRIANNYNAEQTKKSMEAKSMISDYSVITVDGQSAYEFRCHEFCNRQILFDKNSKGYVIKLNSFNDDEYPAYTLLMTSLKIK